ncbi:MAG TPA: DUF3892 domain-containing protein [Bacillus sp. (in: firmicutes)]|uniref:DUF3892 domain-containing protein n=1 Tax=Bacillus litorisediminis TaxID=2922713 RepID=UPI001FABF714|nr:DUF3892 domain-containing protein [Bacillus litorisediminis]HWO76326.1 DUF3892 domain-containing protein [Bacillus sp. (in: firmicutes)]
MEGEYLVAVQKNAFGEIMSFQTSSGRIISYRKAIQEIDEGIIRGYDLIPNDQPLPKIHSIDTENRLMNELPPF